MIVRWISEVPPAIVAALDQSHCRCHFPAMELPSASPHRGALASSTSSAASDSVWVMSAHVSLTTLDSGPGSSPWVSRVKVRQLCCRNTRNLTAASAKASETSMSSSVPTSSASA